MQTAVAGAIGGLAVALIWYRFAWLAEFSVWRPLPPQPDKSFLPRDAILTAAIEYGALIGAALSGTIGYCYAFIQRRWQLGLLADLCVVAVFFMGYFVAGQVPSIQQDLLLSDSPKENALPIAVGAVVTAVVFRIMNRLSLTAAFRVHSAA